MALGRGTRRRTGWLGIVLFVVLVAASAVAVQRSVTIGVRWKVLPYQTLRLTSNGDGEGVAGYEIPEPSAIDLARGYIEDENAVRLHIVSNTPWKVQVWTEAAGESHHDIQIRRRGGSYVPVTASPGVLAAGAHGTYEIDVDYRILLGGDRGEIVDAPLDIVYTIMSE